MATNLMATITTDDIRKALDVVGVTRNYKGFEMLVTAIREVVYNERKLCAVHKEVYSYIALIEKSNSSAVERCIRTAIRGAWAHTPDKLRRLFDTVCMDKPPSNTHFISRMVGFIKENSNNDEC